MAGKAVSGRLGLLRRTYSGNIWTGGCVWQVQATETVAPTDPHLCRTGFLRKELARSQCRQVKKSSWRLALFPSATEALTCPRRGRR